MNTQMLFGSAKSGPQLWLGCWSFGGGEVWGSQPMADSEEVVREALDHGVNVFDTSELYNDGRSEQCLGACLRGLRSRAIIATKAAPGNQSRSSLPKACEGSLRRLQTDYLDLYQIHWPDRDTPFTETFEAMERLKAQGKIREYGVCNFGPADLACLGGQFRPLTNQVAYNLLFRAVEFGLLQACTAAGLTGVAYSPLAQGLLTGKYHNADEVPASLSRTRLFSGRREQAVHEEEGAESEVFSALRAIRALAEESGQPMEALALCWLLARSEVGAVVMGARNGRQLRFDLQAAGARVGAEFLDRLSVITGPVKAKLGPNADMWRSQSRIR